jgi:arylsulfatase A-like enzyme
VGVIRPGARYGLPLAERTLAQALAGAGYETAIAGKWHLGEAPPYLPTRRGFRHQYGLHGGLVDYYRHAAHGRRDWYRNDRPLKQAGYATDLIAAEAGRILNAHDPARPLFLYVAFNAPHAPLRPPPRHMGEYRWLGEPRRTYAATVACMDDAVGSILAALDRRGMRANTLVLFASDNGGEVDSGASSGPLRGGKGSFYEGGIRVPAVAAWTGKLPSGKTVQAPLHLVDLYPTLLKLGGASLEQPLPLDGRDAWPTLAEGKPSPHQELLLNTTPHGGALRKGDWKLVLGREQTAAAGELFDLASDPGEKKDVAGQHPQQAAELRRRLSSYARQAVQPLREREGQQGD